MRREVEYGSLLTINIRKAELKSTKGRVTNAVADLPGTCDERLMVNKVVA